MSCAETTAGYSAQDRCYNNEQITVSAAVLRRLSFNGSQVNEWHDDVEQLSRPSGHILAVLNS